MEEAGTLSDSSSSFQDDTEENQKLQKELRNPVKTFSKALAYIEKNAWNISAVLDTLLRKNIINSESCSSLSDESDESNETAADDTEDVVDGSLLSALQNVAVPQTQSRTGQRYRNRFQSPNSADEIPIDESLLEEMLQYIQHKQHQELHYNPSEEFVAHRFRSQNKKGSESNENHKPKAASPQKYHDPKVQRFTVNRPIFLHRIGFFGPHFTEAKHDVISYEIKVKVIVWVDRPIIIAISREIVEIAKGNKMYVEFQTPVPIRPHLSHWIEFTIKGREKLFVQHRKNRIINAVSGTRAIFKPPYRNIDENDSDPGSKTYSGENAPSVENTETATPGSFVENQELEKSDSIPILSLGSLELTELNNTKTLDLEVKKSDSDKNDIVASQNSLTDSMTWIDFDAESYWTCQVSEIWFHQGNDRIPANVFPSPYKKIKNRFKQPA